MKKCIESLEKKTLRILKMIQEFRSMLKMKLSVRSYTLTKMFSIRILLQKNKLKIELDVRQNKKKDKRLQNKKLKLLQKLRSNVIKRQKIWLNRKELRLNKLNKIKFKKKLINSESTMISELKNELF